MSVTVLCVLAVFSLAAGSPVTYDYDTIVVGLGASGTAAASTLARAGRRVLALEAQDRVGGRVWTKPFGDSTVELGAEWIHGTGNSPTYALAKENNITIVAQNFTAYSYRSDGSRGDSKLLEELVDVMFTERGHPPNPPERFGEFIVRRLTTYITENHPELLNDKDFLTEFFNYLEQTIQGYDPGDSWNDISTASEYTQLDGNQYMSWGRHGYKTLFDILLNRYNNGPGLPSLTIKLNSPVTKVSYSPSFVSVQTADGHTYTAENVIVTVSVGVLKATHKDLFSPPLPQSKIDAINNIAFGVCDKVILRFNETWWKISNSPDTSLYYAFIWKGEDRKKYSERDGGVMSKINGISPPLSVDRTVTVWFCGEAARMMESITEEVLTPKVMEVIRKFLSKDFNITDPVEMTRSTWYSNPYIRGSYSYDNVAMPLHPDVRSTLASPLPEVGGAPRVLFAGEATMEKVFSTVHGAVQSGYREAQRILAV